MYRFSTKEMGQLLMGSVFFPQAVGHAWSNPGLGVGIFLGIVV